tara:strand:- start:139 stop:927 length:789 start_codon:yes stop_codon:yes gene_type:complete
MKKVKKLEKKIEGLREEIQTLHLESRLEIEDHFQATYFKGLPLTRVSSYDFDEINFKIPKENHKYPQDICSIRLSKSDYEYNNFDKIGLNYYSTSEVSDWEINRLVLIGKIAQVVKDEKKSILSSIKTIPSKNNKLISKLRSKIWDLEREIKEIKIEKNRVNRKNSLDLLFKEGIEFETGHLNHCAIRNDHFVRNIKKIQFISWTNENKLSLNVEITTSYPSVFKDKDNGIDDRTEVYNKVRLFNLDHFIGCKTQQLEKELV